jgi:hypothetical protein
MKKQTVAEYLAKGGVIKQIPAGVSTRPSTPPKPESIKSSNAGGPATIISMEDADLYTNEFKPRKGKKKLVEAIDLSALPPELRKKYVDGVINGQQEERDTDRSSN